MTMICYALLLAVAPLVESLSRLQMSMLDNVGLSVPISVSNQSDCTNLCTGAQTSNVSAVSYSKYTNMCILSFCGNLQVHPDALWDTYICISPMLSCSLPTPAFEWMMTDTCGFNNTGSISYGLPMTFGNYSSTSPYKLQSLTPTYMPSPVAYLGNCMVYPNRSDVASWAISSSLTLDLRTESVTIFGYIYLSQANYAMIGGFYGIDSNLAIQINQGPVFWGVTYSQSNTANSLVLPCSACTTTCNLDPPINTWIWMAAVYDIPNQMANIYMNNLLYCNKSLPGLVTASLSANIFFTGSRFGYSFAGTTYCIKVYKQVLNLSQLANIASSCLKGKLTYT